MRYAKEIEDKLKEKVFDKEPFINLVKAVLNHSPGNIYDQEKLDEAKERSLKLLYRMLFILYAESRKLLPVSNPKYREISIENLRTRLPAMAKEKDGTSAWESLKLLFRVISQGSDKAGIRGANVPEYDGELFAESADLDRLVIRNEYLVPALLDLSETDGKGMDYQNLGVKHIGSIYEALLEYTVKQAAKDLVIYKGQIMDGAYASDLKAAIYLLSGERHSTSFS